MTDLEHDYHEISLIFWTLECYSDSNVIFPSHSRSATNTGYTALNHLIKALWSFVIGFTKYVVFSYCRPRDIAVVHHGNGSTTNVVEFWLHTIFNDTVHDPRTMCALARLIVTLAVFCVLVETIRTRWKLSLKIKSFFLMYSTKWGVIICGNYDIPLAIGQFFSIKILTAKSKIKFTWLSFHTWTLWKNNSSNLQ